MPNIAGAIISIAPQVAFGLGILLLIVFLWRRRNRPCEPACGKCGYAVHGLPTFECPECGSDLRTAGIVTIGPLAPITAWQVGLLWLLLAPGFAWVLSGPLHAITISGERVHAQQTCTVDGASLRLVKTLSVTWNRPDSDTDRELPTAGPRRICVVRHGQIESGSAVIPDDSLLRDEPAARDQLRNLIRTAILEIPPERGDERTPPEPEAADADAEQIAAALRASASSENTHAVLSRAIPGGTATFSVTPSTYRQYQPLAYPTGFGLVLILSAVLTGFVHRAATRRGAKIHGSSRCDHPI